MRCINSQVILPWLWCGCSGSGLPFRHGGSHEQGDRACPTNALLLRQEGIRRHLWKGKLTSNTSPLPMAPVCLYIMWPDIRFLLKRFSGVLFIILYESIAEAPKKPHSLGHFYCAVFLKIRFWFSNMNIFSLFSPKNGGSFPF